MESDDLLKLKVDILRMEYESIRIEVLHKLSQMFATTGLFGASVAWLLSNVDSSATKICAILFVTMFLGVVWWVLAKNLSRCNCQVADIEKRINHIIKEDLLTWEIHQDNLGLLDRLFRNAFSCSERRK